LENGVGCAGRQKKETRNGRAKTISIIFIMDEQIGSGNPMKETVPCGNIAYAETLLMLPVQA
jgi:hypothetical protein